MEGLSNRIHDLMKTKHKDIDANARKRLEIIDEWSFLLDSCPDLRKKLQAEAEENLRKVEAFGPLVCTELGEFHSLKMRIQQWEDTVSGRHQTNSWSLWLRRRVEEDLFEKSVGLVIDFQFKAEAGKEPQQFLLRLRDAARTRLDEQSPWQEFTGLEDAFGKLTRKTRVADISENSVKDAFKRENMQSAAHARKCLEIIGEWSRWLDSFPGLRHELSSHAEEQLAEAAENLGNKAGIKDALRNFVLEARAARVEDVKAKVFVRKLRLVDAHWKTTDKTDPWMTEQQQKVADARKRLEIIDEWRFLLDSFPGLPTELSSHAEKQLADVKEALWNWVLKERADPVADVKELDEQGLPTGGEDHWTTAQNQKVADAQTRFGKIDAWIDWLDIFPGLRTKIFSRAKIQLVEANEDLRKAGRMPQASESLRDAFKACKSLEMRLKSLQKAIEATSS